MGFYTGAISQKKIQSGEKDTVEKREVIKRLRQRRGTPE